MKDMETEGLVISSTRAYKRATHTGYPYIPERMSPAVARGEREWPSPPGDGEVAEEANLARAHPYIRDTGASIRKIWRERVSMPSNHHPTGMATLSPSRPLQEIRVGDPPYERHGERWAIHVSWPSLPQGPKGVPHLMGIPTCQKDGSLHSKDRESGHPF